MTNPADIARALSEKQQQAIINAEWVPGLTYVVDFTDPWKFPVAEFLTLKRDRLTPLGLAVRDYLLHRPTANDASTDRTPATVDGCGKGIE